MTHDTHIPSFYILYSIQVCPIEPTRLLVKELREGGKTNIDMVEWEQVCSQVLLNIFLYATLMYLWRLKLYISYSRKALDTLVFPKHLRSLRKFSVLPMKFMEKVNYDNCLIIVNRNIFPGSQQILVPVPSWCFESVSQILVMGQIVSFSMVADTCAWLIF